MTDITPNHLQSYTLHIHNQGTPGILQSVKAIITLASWLASELSPIIKMYPGNIDQWICQLVSMHLSNTMCMVASDISPKSSHCSQNLLTGSDIRTERESSNVNEMIKIIIKVIIMTTIHATGDNLTLV